MPKRCVIVAAMPVPAGMLCYVRPDDYIIAVDGGWLNAQSLGLRPHVVLGDFDSSPKPDGAAELMVLPAEKDDTDTHFAAREALRRGADEVVILGGLGGRLDHTLANLQTLLMLAEAGADALLASEQTEVRCLRPGTTCLQKGRFTLLSVFAAGGPARGVFLQGLKYPLYNATLTPAYPLGASNEFVAETAQIRCDAGFLYTVASTGD